MINLKDAIVECLVFLSNFLEKYSIETTEYTCNCIMNGSRSNAQAKLYGNPNLPLNYFKKLKDGWLGPEALGLALYYCLKYGEEGWEKVIHEAANINGDSDTVASIAGNLYGIQNGYSETEDSFCKLQHKELFLKMGKYFFKSHPFRQNMYSIVRNIQYF